MNPKNSLGAASKVRMLSSRSPHLWDSVLVFQSVCALLTLPCVSVQSVHGCRRDRGSSVGCLHGTPCLCSAWNRRSSAAGPSASGTESRFWWSNSQLLAFMRTVSDGQKDEAVTEVLAVSLTFFRVNFVLHCWVTPVRRSCFNFPVPSDSSEFQKYVLFS